MNIIEIITEELLKRTETFREKNGYDLYEDHIKHVVNNAIYLAKEAGADIEIVHLGALLHDIAKLSGIGPREEHNIYGAQIAEELLRKYNYPQEKIDRVKQCVLNHRGIKDWSRSTIEEECVADADALAHFDAIPSLFSLAYQEMNLNIEEGSNFVKKKLERDYNKLSQRSKLLYKDKYDNIMNVLFKSQ